MADDERKYSLNELIELNKKLNSNFPNGWRRDWSWDGKQVPFMLHHLMTTVVEQQETIKKLEHMVQALTFVAWKRTSDD